ncbi:MAG: hypothetical protein Q8R28_24030 [Dehalococcoidia bacterium]|nr:hypothetical protein [Dehalococcoidia bacterium]
MTQPIATPFDADARQLEREGRPPLDVAWSIVHDHQVAYREGYADGQEHDAPLLAQALAALEAVVAEYIDLWPGHGSGLRAKAIAAQLQAAITALKQEVERGD